MVDTSKITSVCKNREVSTNSGQVWNDQSMFHDHIWHRSILMTLLTALHRHKCVVGCCSETRDWDHRNVQQCCQARAATHPSARYLKHRDHNAAMLTWPSTTGMARAGTTTSTARATTADTVTQTFVDIGDVDDEIRYTSNFRSYLMEHPEVTACTALVKSGTSTKRVSHETKTMCSSMTTKKSSH